jgi:hypothetical protein
MPRAETLSSIPGIDRAISKTASKSIVPRCFAIYLPAMKNGEWAATESFRVSNVLREVPDMTFRILDAIATVSVSLIGRLLDDRPARLLAAPMVRIHVVDVDVEILRLLAEFLGVPVPGSGVAHHDNAFREFHLGMDASRIRSHLDPHSRENQRLS